MTTDWTCSFLNVTYSDQVSMGLDLSCQQLRLFQIWQTKLQFHQKKNKYTVGVFIDLKRILILLIMIYCVQNCIYMVCMVSHRNGFRVIYKIKKQFVSFNNCHSEIENVSSGLPQGSILGPKLFIMYINYISKVSQVLKNILFADDTNLLCCDRDLNELKWWIRTTADVGFC